MTDTKLRLKRFTLSLIAFSELLREGKDHHIRITHGIPADAHIIDVRVEHATLTASLLVQSDTFEPVSDTDRLFWRVPEGERMSIESI